MNSFEVYRVHHSVFCHLWDYKYLSCVWDVDRKICHKGHWSAPWSSIHSSYSWQILFVAENSCLQHMIVNKGLLKCFTRFYLILKGGGAFNDQHSVLCFNFCNSILWPHFVMFMKSERTNVTWRHACMSSYTNQSSR